MTSLDRREFLRRAAAIGAGGILTPSLGSLSLWSWAGPDDAQQLRALGNGQLGVLRRSADCPELWIPDGFKCVRLSTSRLASVADPTFTVPNAMDGMAAFPMSGGSVRLIRNHEMANGASRAAPLGTKHYDSLASGGTVSLTVRMDGTGASRSVRVTEEFVSLGGTHINCAGGRTPWGSWLSCEETTNGERQGFGKPHGYIFEVPVAATSAVDPLPLKAMGRFVHEAVAVDPITGYVYETEDVRYNPNNTDSQPGAGFYRFLPNTRARLEAGGRLQILTVRDAPQKVLTVDQTVGQKIAVTWIDVDNPDPAEAEADQSAVFRASHAKGAAIFARLEGCFWADDSCYFVSTDGGNAKAGQVWRYIPEGADGGSLTLIFESPSRDVLDAPDNICVSASGSVVICEDGSDEQYIRVLTKSGTMMNLVMQPQVPGQSDPREFAGCCFSPDAEVLFFNIQGSTTSYGMQTGGTYALWGPWDRAE